MNSIMLDGRVTEINGNSFILETTDNEVNTYHFTVSVKGTHSLTVGKVIRVVGRIKENNGHVSIIAEYAAGIGKEVA